MPNSLKKMEKGNDSKWLSTCTVKKYRLRDSKYSRVKYQGKILSDMVTYGFQIAAYMPTP